MKSSTYAGAGRYGAGAFGILFLTLLCQTGCGKPAPDLPDTYAVTGKVLQADGKAMSGGLIEFQSTVDPPVTTNGVIQQDGTFSLSTMVEGEKLPGAIPGTYRVVIMPPMSDQPEEQHSFEPISVSQTYEVKSEGTNEFTIEL